MLKQSLFSPFELLCVCRLCFFFMLAKFLIRYIEKFQWAYMRNISIHLTSAVGDFCLMRVLRGYVILQVFKNVKMLIQKYFGNHSPTDKRIWNSFRVGFIIWMSSHAPCFPRYNHISYDFKGFVVLYYICHGIFLVIMIEYDWMGSFLFKGVQINGEEYDNTTSSGITISLCTIVKLNVHVSNQSGKS